MNSSRIWEKFWQKKKLKPWRWPFSIILGSFKNYGSFFNHVDKILAFFENLPIPGWHLWRNFFPVTRKNLQTVDILSTTYLPPLVNVLSLWTPTNTLTRRDGQLVHERSIYFLKSQNLTIQFWNDLIGGKMWNNYCNNFSIHCRNIPWRVKERQLWNLIPILTM